MRADLLLSKKPSLTIIACQIHNEIMPKGRLQTLLGLALFFALFGTSLAQARVTLLVLNDGVVVYSGPATRFRPLAILPQRTELRASATILKTKDGDFYKVLVVLSEKHKAVGYIATAAEVKLITSPVDEEDLERYGGIALVNRAIQVSYSRFTNQEASVQAGYLRYLSPGFYLKGFAGQYITSAADATIAGGEIGNDALLFGKLSGIVSYAAGVFLPLTAGAVFEGSKKVNAMAQASAGLRYNLNGETSMSVAATQLVLFNANNSHVTYGINFTLEVGL